MTKRFKCPRVPAYRHHRQSGQAIVTLPDGFGGRRDFLLGLYESEQSYAEYARITSEWLANDRRLHRSKPAATEISVSEVILAYWRHCEGYYRHANGRPTSEIDIINLGMRSLRRLRLCTGNRIRQLDHGSGPRPDDLRRALPQPNQQRPGTHQANVQMGGEQETCADRRASKSYDRGRITGRPVGSASKGTGEVGPAGRVSQRREHSAVRPVPLTPRTTCCA